MLQSEQVVFNIRFFSLISILRATNVLRLPQIMQDACAVLEVLARDPVECAKLVGIILMHFGQLRAYGQGNPAVIQVDKAGLCVNFNAWNSKRNVHERQITAIITEAIFVKRVSNMLILMVINNISIHYNVIKSSTL